MAKFGIAPGGGAPQGGNGGGGAPQGGSGGGGPQGGSGGPPGGSGGPPGGGGGPMGPSPAETNAKMIKAFCQETGHYWTYALEKYAG